MKRKYSNSRKSKKRFSRTASKTNSRNFTTIKRGGIRL